MNPWALALLWPGIVPKGIETYLYGRSLEYDLFEGLRSPAQVYFKKFAAVENCH